MNMNINIYINIDINQIMFFHVLYLFYDDIISMKITVIGGGFVGNATASINSQNITINIYDIDKSKCIPSNITYQDIFKDDVDLIMVCLPTPYNSETEECITTIIDDFIINATKIDNKIIDKIIIRSTVPPLFCEKYNVSHMPEFLTEKNPIETFKNTN